MRTWKVASLTILSLILVVGAAFRASFADEKIDIALYVNEGKPYHLAYAKAFVESINKIHFPFHVVTLNAETTRCNKESPTFIIAVGIDNLRRCLETDRKQNLLAVLVTQSAINELLQRFQNRPPLSAIVLDQPIKRHLDVVRSVFPSASIVTVLADANSISNVDRDLKNYSSDLKVQLFTGLNYPHVPKSIEESIKRSDVIITLPKSHVENAREAKWLLNFEYQNRVPVFAFSASYVLAGAIGATYSTPEQFARQSVEWLTDTFDKRTFTVGKIEHPKFFKISLNTSVLDALNLLDEVDMTVVDKNNDIELVPDDTQMASGNTI